MNLFGVMDVSASALKAERVRAEVVAANMANAETTQTEEGGPYRRHHGGFSAEGGGSFAQSMSNQLGSSQLGAGQLGSAQGGFGSGLTGGFGAGFSDAKT